MYRWIPQNSVEIAHPDGLGVRLTPELVEALGIELGITGEE